MEKINNYIKRQKDAIRHRLRVWLGVVALEVRLDNKLASIRSKQASEAYIDKKFKDLEDRVARFIEYDNAKLRGEVNQLLLKFYEEKIKKVLN